MAVNRRESVIRLCGFVMEVNRRGSVIRPVWLSHGVTERTSV